MRFSNDARHGTGSHCNVSPPKVRSILAQRLVEGKQHVEEIIGKLFAM
jgi:hypothetical protein